MAEVSVKPAGKGYDIDITGEATASEVVDAIVAATGVDIKGEPEDANVPANRLRNVSLERALRTLLPHVPFALRLDADDTPQAIIFMAKTKGDGSPDDTDDGQASGPQPPDPANPDLSDPYSPDPMEPPAADEPTETPPQDDTSTDGN